MSVRSETLPQQTRRIPIVAVVVAVVAAILAFSLGIALGATLTGGDTAATHRQTTLVVPTTNPSDGGAARLETREDTVGSRPVPLTEPAQGQSPELRTNSRERSSDLEAAMLRNETRRG